MFHDIPQPVLDQMKALEEIDAQDRQDGTPLLKRLRQISPETGRLLAILAADTPKGTWLEIGTSGGYSALWLSRAAILRDARLVTFELLPDKVELARRTFSRAQVEDLIELVHGDARGHMDDYEEISFCFIDAEREMYQEIFDRVVPYMLPGGIVVVNNAVSYQTELVKFLNAVTDDSRLDSVIVEIGTGLLVSRKV
jgi:caffeoyl-CoA O-methyltransferase